MSCGGGGISANASVSGVVKNTLIENNSAEGPGGGFSGGFNTVISNTLFKGNSVTDSNSFGGNAAFLTDNSTIQQSCFEDNTGVQTSFDVSYNTNTQPTNIIISENWWGPNGTVPSTNSGDTAKETVHPTIMPSTWLGERPSCGVSRASIPVTFDPNLFPERTLAECTANYTDTETKENCWIHVTVFNLWQYPKIMECVVVSDWLKQHR
jgi:hypothetical protein